MTVLILGGLDDAHACHMLEQLRARGGDAELFDSRWFPTALRLAYDPTAHRGTIRLPTGRLLSFDQVYSVYWRCYNNVQPPDLPDAEQAYIATNDARGLFESLLISLPARWINGWRAYQLHQTKPVQLALVAALGVPVPATLLTNDAEVVREFAARQPRCIFKPVQGGAHTQRLTPSHLTDDNLRNLSYAPVTLQEEVPGTNVRAFVAGERVLACEVRTGALDFRDDQDPQIVPHDLPAEVAGQCLRAARALDLVWTGIDLRLTPEGRYVFLEANPSPMFLGFESRSGLPLTDSLAALLLEEDT
jgi:glutathione synthase/RimK-type ligase-like ATP-grasp enzyme